MPLLTRRTQFAIAEETTPGDVETLTATNAAILAYETTLNPSPTFFKRDPYTKTLSRYNSIPGQRICEATMKCELMGPVSSRCGDTGPLKAIFGACAFSETLDTGTSTTYKPLSTSQLTYTIGVYEDGVKKLMSGAMGNLILSGVLGEPMMVECTFRGKYESVTDVDLLTPTYPTQKPFIFIGATLAYGGTTLRLNNISIDMRNEVALRSDVTSSAGIDYAFVTSRDPIATIDPEMELVATHDFFGKLLSEATYALNIYMVSPDGVHVHINIPSARYTAVNPGDRDGIRTVDATFELTKKADAGDDEISIGFVDTSSSSSSSSSSLSSSSSSSSSSSTST